MIIADNLKDRGGMLGMWIALNSQAQRGFFKWLNGTALVSTCTPVKKVKIKMEIFRCLNEFFYHSTRVFNDPMVKG